MDNQISKNNEFFQMIKEYKKHPKNEYYVVEELFILELSLKYDCEIVGMIYCEELCYGESTKRIIIEYKHKTDQIYKISKKVYMSLAEKDNSSGIIALIHKPYIDLLNSNQKFERVLVIDGIEIPGNLGTMIRTGDATNFDLIIMVNKVTSFSHHKTISSSRGMFLKIPFAQMSYNDAQKYLIDNDFNIYLGEPLLGKKYNEYNYEGNIALVVGNERYGIYSKWYEYKHNKVYIPMYGEMKSLNVSIAASILMYEVASKKETLNK